MLGNPTKIATIHLTVTSLKHSEGRHIKAVYSRWSAPDGLNEEGVFQQVCGVLGVVVLLSR
jgi:hypothetical protein